MLSKLFEKKNSLEELTLKKIKNTIDDQLKINYMILSKRSLLISNKTFVTIYSRFILDNILVDKNNLKIQNPLNGGKNSWNIFLQEIINKIDAWDTDFIFDAKISEFILKKFLRIRNIENDFEVSWNIITQNDTFTDMLKYLDEKYSNLEKSEKERIKTSLTTFNNLHNFKNYTHILKEWYIILNVGWVNEVYTTKENLRLSTIKDFSYYIEDKQKYSINILWDDFFAYKKNEIEEYNSNKVYGLSEVRNPFLMTYLANNMTNYDFGDLNITYFYADPLNPHKINASVRHKWKYKILNYRNIKDFDLNVLDSDIITLGWKLSGVVTVTNLKVGRFSYRVLIIRKNWIYFLNIRKTEWVPYTVRELEQKSQANIKSFIIDESNEELRVKLHVDYPLKHFDIDFPLWYSDEDSDSFFSKLASSSKGTFWINGKTNSWKSTSLKNLIKRYYDYSKETLHTNKNILMIENPIEWYDYYLKQIEVDDEDIDDYKAIIMWIKRADLDMCVFWELRTYDVFGIFNEVSNSLPVFSTFHVGTAESFLSILKYYSDKAWLNYLDVFWNVNASIIQIPLETESAAPELRNYYSLEEKNDLLEMIYTRFRINTENIEWKQQEFKSLITDIINTMFEKNIFPIKSYTTGKYRLNYEILTWDMLGLFLDDEQTNVAKIYDYLGYTNNILYKTFVEFIDGKMIFDIVKIDEYSHDVKMKTLTQIQKYLELK